MLINALLARTALMGLFQILRFTEHVKVELLNYQLKTVHKVLTALAGNAAVSSPAMKVLLHIHNYSY